MIQELVSIRKKMRISQTEAARRIGTSQSNLARIESGKVDPHYSFVERYARALGCELFLSELGEQYRD